MDVLVNVCIIVLTAAVVFILVMVGRSMQDVRRMRVRMIDCLDMLEREVKPLLSEAGHIAEDIREITFTTRCQIQKVESTTDFINKNLHDIMGRWIALFNVLSDALAEPIEDITVFLKGVHRGMRYFWGNGRKRERQ